MVSETCVSPTRRVLRAFGGLISWGLAAVLIVAGGLYISPGVFVAVAFYLVFGLYILFSATARVRMTRFIIEGVTLLVVSLVVFLAMPVSGHLPQGAVTYDSASKPAAPKAVLEYMEAGKAVCSGIERFVSTKKIKDDNEAVSLVRDMEMVRLDDAFRSLPPNLQKKLSYSHAMLHALVPLLRNLETKMPQFLPKGPAAWLPKALAISIKKHVESIRIQLNKEKIDLMSQFNFDKHQKAASQ